MMLYVKQLQCNTVTNNAVRHAVAHSMENTVGIRYYKFITDNFATHQYCLPFELYKANTSFELCIKLKCHFVMEFEWNGLQEQ